MRIANLIEEDYRYEQLEAEEPNLANSMARKAAKWARSSQRRRIIRKAADVAGINRIKWGEGEKLKLGAKLIEVFVETTGAAEIRLASDGTGAHSTQRILHMNDEVRERISDRRDELALDEPVHRPMVHPPQAWTSATEGGYLTEKIKRPILFGANKRRITKNLLDEIPYDEMPGAYDALNAVQATAWRVNRPIYEAMQQAWDVNMQDTGFPDKKDLPLPPLPRGLPKWSKNQQLDEKQEEQLTRWKAEARGIHGRNNSMKSKRRALITQLANAKQVVDERAIYFPHAFDFRGRMYPMSTELSPQSDDFSKAVLEFAEGKPLGVSGGYWLCVHLANLFGNDKISFDDRVLWVQMHHNEITQSAQRPFEYTWWTEADEPWCFLAACFEYAAWQTQGDSYVSHLPIAMDGSCSGLQHFSAMLRDQRGAAATNLTNTDMPSDIYREVLHVVEKKLAESKEPMAKIWMGKVTRKIVKRPCMTYAYGVTSVGIRDQITDELRKTTDGCYLEGVDNWEAARALAPLVEEAIEEVVERAAEAMDWLRSVTKAVNKNDQHAGWETPLGFKVIQPYLKTRGKRVTLIFNGQQMRLTLSVEGMAVNGREHVTGVAPNFVHSMDACHLQMTVNRMKEVTDSFAVIHDSFGVHACDVDELNYALRDEFINLYSDNDVLLNFYQTMQPRAKDEDWVKITTPPEAGDYDIEEVRDADFFFA
jgi:DNA-directed RNA polymerase